MMQGEPQAVSVVRSSTQTCPATSGVLTDYTLQFFGLYQNAPKKSWCHLLEVDVAKPSRHANQWLRHLTQNTLSIGFKITRDLMREKKYCDTK